MSLLIDTSFKLHGYIESQIGGRAENQDSAGAMETSLGTVVVVCDGMGGMNGGKTASMLAVKTIIDDVSEATKDANPEDVLIDAFKHAQKAILDKAASDSDLKGMGTTATAIIISNKCATVAHIGDSRIYQLRGKRIVFRTNDHSMVFQLVAAGTLTEEQARLSAQSNIILKALGVEGDAVPDVKSLPYLKGDRFVLCTDGFWGAFPERTFIKLITKRGNLKDILWDATKEINKQGIQSGGAHDNLTAAVFDMECESIIKPQMSKRLKITLFCLFTVLFISICVNVLMFKRVREERPKLDAAKEYVSALKDSSKTDIQDAAKTKFIEAFKGVKDTTQKEVTNNNGNNNKK